MNARILVPALTLIAGLGIGYWLGERSHDEDAPTRSTRTARADAPPARPSERDDDLLIDGEPIGLGLGKRGALPGKRKDTGAAGLADLAKLLGGDGDSEDSNDKKDMAKSLGTLMKAAKPFMELQAKKEATELAKVLAEKLGLDEERAKLLAEILTAEKTKQMERVFTMFDSEEGLDLEKMMEMEKPDGLLSDEAEEELARHFSQSELDGIKDHMKAEKERKINEAFDLQIDTMGIPDLSDDQRTQMRTILQNPGDNGAMDKKMFRDMLTGKGDGLTEENLKRTMEASFERRRERVRAVLSPEQFEKYRESEKSQMEMMKAGMQLFASFANTSRKKKDEK